MTNNLIPSINSNELANIIQDKKYPLVIVDFYANWCSPCKPLGATLERLAEKYSKNAKFVKVDIEQNRELGIKYDIRSLPSLLFIKNGETKLYLTGNRSYEDLEKRIDSFKNSSYQ
jgi:thioredoxin 1